MAASFMSPEGAQRLMQFAEEGREPPKVIKDLKARIELTTRLAERDFGRNPVIDQEVVTAIVAMKRELDVLYAKWGEGLIT